MLTPVVRNWFGRGAVSEDAAVLANAPVSIAPPADNPPRPSDPTRWSPDRLAVAGTLWGDGFLFPGGEVETLRLAKPLGLSAASSLFLLGVGGGGPACSVATHLGVWVSGFEADQDLADAATDRVVRAKLGRRAQIATWDPAEPAFSRHAYHHGLALEPLRSGKPEPTLAAVADALKPGGQLVLVELVADVPLDPSDPSIRRWAHLERRKPDTLPTETAITRVLGRLGFDIRVTEDVSARHMREALLGWKVAVRAMEDSRPSRHTAAVFVNEAELWLLRMRLFRRGQLRLVRWHAIGRAAL